MARLAYAKAADLNLQYSKIQDKQLDVGTLEYFILKAEYKVKALIGLRYDIGFATVPPLLRFLTVDLAGIYIYRRFFQGVSLLPNQNNEAIEEKIMQQLRDIRDGDENLYDEDDTLIGAKEGVGDIDSNTDGYNPTMNEDSEVYQEYDPDKIDDLRDELD